MLSKYLLAFFYGRRLMRCGPDNIYVTIKPINHELQRLRLDQAGLLADVYRW